MQPAGQVTWQQLEPLYNQLLGAIGTGVPVSTDVYNSVMQNLSLIPNQRVIEYQRAVVTHLLSMVGVPYQSPDNLHPGDVIEEEILGIPRRNNVKIGDLLGLELKSFSGSSPLSLTSFSCVKEIIDNLNSMRSQTQTVLDTWDVVWFPTHKNHHNQTSRPTHHLWANENFRSNQLGRFSNLTLRVDAGNMVWSKQPGNDVVKTESLDSLFDKFSQGILLLDITGTMSSPNFTINGIYYAPDFNPQGIAQYFVNGDIKFEIRYDLPKKNAAGISQCTMPRNTGHAFRMTASKVRNNLMTPANKIDTISDFI